MTPLVRRALSRVLMLVAAIAPLPVCAQYGVPAPVTPAVSACAPFQGFPMVLNLGSASLLGLDGATSRCGFTQVQAAFNTRGQAAGLASLDQNGLLPTTQLPPISLNLPNGGSLQRLSLATDIALGGPAGVAPSMSGLGYQINARRYATGTASQGVNLSLVNVEGDTATVIGPNFLNVFTVQSTFGGSTVQGGRQGVQVGINQSAATSPINQNRNYVGGTFIASTSSGDGGDSLVSAPETAAHGSKGAYFGINPVALLQPGAVNVANVSGGEFNVSAAAGSSVRYKSGIQIAALGSDAVQGSDLDAAISVSAQGGVGWRDGILFGTQNGAFPFTPGSTVIRATGGQIKTALDFSGVGITDSLLKGTSGAIIDNATSWRIAQGGAVMLTLIGNPTTGSLSLLGSQNGVAPYWQTPGDFTIRSAPGTSGVLDMLGAVVAGAPAATGYVTAKVSGQSVKLLVAQ